SSRGDEAGERAPIECSEMIFRGGTCYRIFTTNKFRRNSMNLIGTAAISVLVLVPISLQSQSEQSAKSVQQMPMPSPQMLSLNKAIAGKWATSYNFAPDKAHPDGYSSEGEEVWRPGPGGFTLIEEERIGSDIFLLALHWWDNSTNTLR